MDIEQQKNVIEHLTAPDVERSYRGRVGCMCGCRGHYRSAPRTKRSDVSRIRLLAAAKLTHRAEGIHVDIADDLQYVFVEMDGRVSAAYLTDEGQQRLRALIG
jgi:hypothetical protein